MTQPTTNSDIGKLNVRKRDMPEYKAWEQMKQRCRNYRYSTWKNYGGRGIKVCEEWLNDFPAFYKHIGPKPKPYNEYSLDRIDNDGNYEPGNVRWATRYQQQKNRRLHKDNKSGASGITWSDKKNGWSVMDFRDDKCHYIGFYPLLGKAIDALVEYRVQLELAQEANKAGLEHSVGILDNVILLLADPTKSKSDVVVACIRQCNELNAQLTAEKGN